MGRNKICNCCHKRKANRNYHLPDNYDDGNRCSFCWSNCGTFNCKLTSPYTISKAEKNLHVERYCIERLTNRGQNRYYAEVVWNKPTSYFSVSVSDSEYSRILIRPTRKKELIDNLFKQVPKLKEIAKSIKEFKNGTN